jgi:ABC-type transport system involved in multi-copper enzyme maturation permease subunit
MSIVEAPPRVESSAASPSRARYRVTGRRVLRSEWAKLWSLRSTWITLGLGLVALLGIATIAASRYTSIAGSGQRGGGDLANATAVELALFGVAFAQLALGVLGVMSSAGEYSSGSIRSTLTAVPRRLPVLWSKIAVLGGSALVVAAVGAFAGFLVADPILAGTAAHLSLTGAGVARSLAGAALYLGLVGVIGLALGFLLRSVAGGIATLVAVLLLLPGLLALLPTSWSTHIGPYLPSNAGGAIYALHQAPGTLSPGGGTLVLLAWTVVAVAAAAWRLATKDA